MCSANINKIQVQYNIGMANNVLKEISVNLGVTGYDDSSLLIGIADYYGVNTTISNNLMGDILDAVGGNAAISNNYIQDIVIALGGPSTSNNWIEEWEIITAGPPVPAPVNTVAPVISGTMVVGQTLTTTNGTWTNSPTSFTYKWYKGITAIVGATSSTYILVQADAGTTTAIKCEVTAINLGGSTAADSNTLTTVYDADAQAFITATGITDLTQKNAINQLVLDLKGYSIWTKMNALYPFVGGTATTHKYNLKNPLDTNAAFRLVFSGGWTHSSTGALPNGSNGYADTKLIPNTILNLNSAHISFYSRTNISSGTDIGSSNAAFASGIYILNKYIADGRNYFNLHGVGSTIQIPGFTRGDGFFCLRRNNSTQIINSRNSSNTTYSQNSTSKTTSPIFISALNVAGTNNFYSARECAFSSIGEGLSDTESSNLNTAVTTFQTSLSRNV